MEPLAAVYVIGWPGKLRSVSLEGALESSPWPVTFVSPVVVDDGQVNVLSDREAVRLLFGRSLTSAEVGCALAHRNAYAAARDEGIEWALVIEDDAEFSPSAWARITRLVNAHPVQDRKVITLYAGDRDRGKNHSCGTLDLLRLRYPPTHAVAYLINRSSLVWALSQPRPIISTADWPPWSAGVDFFALPESGIHHGEGPSVIGERPAPKSGLRTMVRLATLVQARSRRLGRIYFPDAGSYWKWTLLAPSSKFLRRQRNRLGKRRHE